MNSGVRLALLLAGSKLDSELEGWVPEEAESEPEPEPEPAGRPVTEPGLGFSESEGSEGAGTSLA